jgi:hypothetical protein
MLEASNYTKASIANAEFGGEPHVSAETYFLKFFSDTVDLDGDGTEITTLDYVPTEIDNDTLNFPHTTNGIKTNAIAIPSATLGADSPEIVSVGLFDEDDNLRYRKVFDTPFVIASGSYYNLAVGELTFTVSSAG